MRGKKEGNKGRHGIKAGYKIRKMRIKCLERWEDKKRRTWDKTWREAG